MTGRVRCMERNTAKYSEIQRNSIQDAIQQSCPYSRPSAHRSPMSQAITLAELERRLQIRLASPIPAAYQRHNYEPNLVRGHEAAIRLVDAGNYVCLCCPAPLRNNGMFKTGTAFSNVMLCHVSTRQHSALRRTKGQGPAQAALDATAAPLRSGGRTCPVMARSRRRTRLCSGRPRLQ